MNPYLQSVEEALASVDSSTQGLTQEEAGKRLVENGANQLAEEKKTSILARFWKQLTDPMIIILLIAAVLSGITSIYEGESLADVFIISIVILINAVLGVYQESKAEKSIDALQKMMAPESKVIRGGHLTHVPSHELVVGDVIVLEAGDAVPADARIIESASQIGRAHV